MFILCLALFAVFLIWNTNKPKETTTRKINSTKPKRKIPSKTPTVKTPYLLQPSTNTNVKSVPVIHRDSKIQEFDKYMDSFDVVFIFYNTNKPNWQQIKLILKATALIFEERPEKHAACATYNITPKSIKFIKSMQKTVQNWNSVHIFMKNTEALLPYQYRRWLDCYLTSLVENFPDQYCQGNLIDPDYFYSPDYFDYNVPVPNRAVLTPCKNVIKRLDCYNTASYEAQYMEAACSQGCNLCPKFKLNKFLDQSKRTHKKTRNDNQLQHTSL